MRITRLKLTNWRNFRDCEVSLAQRTMVLGANASGKSNFLDSLRFLRDVCSEDGGGIQRAISTRGGFSKVRCLAARRNPNIEFEVWLFDPSDGSEWRYKLHLRQEQRGYRRPIVHEESARLNGRVIFNRPNKDDTADEERLTQSYIEQVSENKDFRPVARFFSGITYLHLVPQLLRYYDQIQGRTIETDPFGQGFLERVAKTSEKQQKARLKKIEAALKIAVPNLEQLRFSRDGATGRPHLEARYSHWRPNAGIQREDQFSDGTLRLIGLLWALLEDDSLLLLEEPELSLNASIVSRLAPLISRLQRQRKRQVILTTHSVDLLSDPGIAAEEVIVLDVTGETSKPINLPDLETEFNLVKNGFSIGEAVLPRTAPEQIDLLAKIDS